MTKAPTCDVGRIHDVKAASMSYCNQLEGSKSTEYVDSDVDLDTKVEHFGLQTSDTENYYR